MAVKKLSVDMYEGQITALLGHNGAGNSADYSSYSAIILILSLKLSLLCNMFT